jgi:O-antigen/teichoic acid export membrane protein
VGKRPNVRTRDVRSGAGFTERLSGLPLLGRFLGGDPLLRNGVMLTLASIAASVLGAAYWIFVGAAGLKYKTAEVGTNQATIFAVMFLGGVAQLNLADVMVRFTPSAGRNTRRIVVRAYLAAISLALVSSVGFVLLIPWVAPGLDFVHTPVMGGVFVFAVATYAIFVIQDGVLTGLRRTHWVLGEQMLFSVSKIVAVGLLFVVARSAAMLVSWTIALVLALVFVNTYLFGFAIPAREREVHRMERRPSWARDHAPGDVTGMHLIPTETTDGMIRFTALTYVGGLFWLAVSTLPQTLILDTFGKEGKDDSAYFSISWVITTMLYVISANMGSSIVVESAGDPRRLVRAVRTVLRNTGVLLLGGALVVGAAAPLVLRLFGPDYPGHATVLLRLLAVSSVPNLITATALAAFRVRRKAGMVLVVYAAICGLVFGMFWVLKPTMGLAAMGMAWLLTQLLVAGLLLVFRRAWLPTGERARPERAAKKEKAATGGIPLVTLPQQREWARAEEEY